MALPPEKAICSARTLTVEYDGVVAVSAVTLEMARGSICGLLGANGAGKTSVLRALAGLVRSTGAIELDGRPINHVPGHRRARMGLVLVPEGRGILASLTVEENLQLGVNVRYSGAQARERLAAIYDEFPFLQERRHTHAGVLSGGEQQQLAIARGLASDPSVLLLDEPSLGLAPKMIDIVFDLIARLGSKGSSMLLVEQNAQKALQLVSYGYVMETGRVVFQGAPSELETNDAVRRAYLGG